MGLEVKCRGFWVTQFIRGGIAEAIPLEPRHAIYSAHALRDT